MLLLDRKCCQWSILRGPSATCADVCGNENAYRNGFCVLFHLTEGVADFMWHLGVTDIRDLPLAMSSPTFPPCRELLKENCPEMKRNFVKFRLETGHWITYLELPEGAAQIRQCSGNIGICGWQCSGCGPESSGTFLEGPCYR